MMPEDKAKELMLKYYDLIPMNTVSFAKQCALIAVNEIIKVCPYISKNNCTSLEQVRADEIEFSDYWQEVKREIEKL